MSLSDDVALLEDELAKVKDELEAANGQLEIYEQAIGEDETAASEIRQLREFIGDLRLGIRTLDEYEDVCGGSRWIVS